MNIANLLKEYREAENIAVKCGNNSMTYGELYYNINNLSADITYRNSHIGILMDNSIEYLEVFFAIVHSGNTVIPINPKLTRREIIKIIDDCKIVGVFSTLKYKDRIDSTKAAFPVWLVDEILSASIKTEFKEVDLFNRNAVIIPTSGTTGNAKYVVISHEALLCSIKFIDRCFKRKKEGKEAVLISFCSILAISQMLHCFYIGMQLILVEGDFNPQNLCDLFVNEKITSTAMVPSMLKMFGLSAGIGNYKFELLERVFYAGDYLCETDFQTLRKQLPNVSLIQAYGMTEISPICMKDETDYAYKPTAAGRVFPEIEVKIIENGYEVKNGCIGEIYAKGPHMMEGYLNEDFFLLEGFIRTGDMGYIDSEDYLFICGRRKNLIISAGQNIYPEEIEAVLQNCPGILDIKIYGRKDEDRGEIVVADIVPEDINTFSREAFFDFCRENIAAYKIPRILNMCSKLEKTITDKKVRR